MQTVKTNLKHIIGECNALYKKVAQFSNEAEKIKQCVDLTDIGKQTKIEDLKADVVKQGEDTYTSISGQLDKLSEDIAEKVNSFDINDTTFIHSIELINAVGGKIGDKIKEDMINRYIGKNTALDMIIAVLKKHSAETIDFEQKKINLQAIDSKIQQAKNSLYFAVADFGRALLTIQETITHITDIADLLNIELDETTGE